MYLPYLRARQFELIALRELIEDGLIGDHILPVVEPIKLSPTLINALSAFTEKNKDIVIVKNPVVGDFLQDIKNTGSNDKKVKMKTTLLEEIRKESVIRGYIINKKNQAELKSRVQGGKLNIHNAITICEKRDDLDAYLDICGKEANRLSLIPDDRSFFRSIEKNKVIFNDRFNKMERNKDYSDTPEEVFSEDHLFYDKEGYVGFGDYSVVGKDFSESGFAPLAVAIHIVYFNKENCLMVKHFVSDSNEDIKDPAGKFGEALDKLVQWVDKERIEFTKGLSGFIDCHKTGKYPGLGTVKKLSIMHHLELMNRFLEAKYSK